MFYRMAKWSSLVVCIGTVGGHAEQLPADWEIGTAETCSHYRQGPTEDLRIAIASGRRDGVSTEGPAISVRPEYLYKPRLPRTRNGELTRSLYAQLDIDTGQPAEEQPYWAERDWTFGGPLDRPYFDLFVSTVEDLPIWIRLGTIGSRHPDPPEIEFQDGVMVSDPEGYVLTGKTEQGMIGVEYPEILSYDVDTFDLFVSKDSSGEITEILNCRRVGSADEPQCEYFLKVEPFIASSLFERTQLPKLDLIKNHTKHFTSCLFKKD